MKKTLLIAFIFISNFSNAQCFEEIKYGGTHTLGLKADGTLWGWGRSDWGHLATTTYTEPNAIQIAGISNISKFYAGPLNTFIIKNDGTLWGTGCNYAGTLGVNSTTESFHSFQQITTTNNWLKISSGLFFTLALKTDGTIWAWGTDTDNQTGNPPATPSQLIPIQIGTSTDWIDIDAGNGNTPFALKADGTLWGWGFNGGYLLVAASSVYSLSTPTQINTETWVKMDGGGGYILAQKADGSLWAWGSGAGRGVGEEIYGGIIPHQVTTDIWKDFSAAGNTSLGIKADGTLWAWGYNTNGKLGDGTTIDRHVPIQIGNETNWETVQAGHSYTSLATKTDGTVWYWIYNYYGEFGNGIDYDQTLYLSPQLASNICLNTLSASSFTKSKVNLYPNPVQNKLFIDTQEAQSYELYSILGSKISEGTLSLGNSIDCSNLTSGVYLLNLTDVFGNISTVKFVKD